MISESSSCALPSGVEAQSTKTMAAASSDMPLVE